MPERAAIYVRVSTLGQERDGTSLDTQQAACEDHCRERGYVVVEHFRDSHTATEYRERSGLTALRQLVERRGADVVVCYALDRLSRNQAHVAILIEHLEDHGARLELVTEDFEDSAVGRFIRSAKAFAAEIEHEKIKERSSRGIRARAAAGKWLPTERPPYGYQWRGGERSALDPNPLTAPIVVRIFQDVAGGLSLRQLATRLTAEGIPTPTGGRVWRTQTLGYLVHQPFYKGMPAAFRVRMVRSHGKRTHFPRPLEEQLPLPPDVCPPLTDPATWESAQATMARWSRGGKTPGSGQFLPETYVLRGFVFCGHCGAPLHAGVEKRATRALYICGANKGLTPGTPRRCDSPVSVNAHRLNAQVFAELATTLKRPSLLMKGHSTDKEPIPDLRPTLAAERDAVERLRTNLTESLGFLSPAARTPVLRKLEALAERLTDIDRRYAEEAARKTGQGLAAKDRRDFFAWCRGRADQLLTAPASVQRDALATLGARIEVRRTGRGINPPKRFRILLDPVAVETPVTG